MYSTLQEKGADVNSQYPHTMLPVYHARDEDDEPRHRRAGGTALHVAVENGHCNLSKHICYIGARFDVQDAEGLAP